MPLRTFLIILAAVALLLGCGRRGALEEPGAQDPGLTEGSSPVPVPPNSAAAGKLSTLDPGSPGAQDPGAAGPAGGPERPFILDPLL